MLFEVKTLLERRNAELQTARQKLAVKPGIALIWVGEEPATAAFVRVKQRKSQELNCEYFLHQFPTAETRQLAAVIRGLNKRSDIDGIVLQLPLPKNVNRVELIELIDPLKDIDNLRGDAPYSPPTPSGIIELLEANNINPAQFSTVILGDGLLVGRPLADEFRRRGWPFEQITAHAEQHARKIQQHNLLIACTGVTSLVSSEMVNREMLVVDGSGVDVDLKTIEPLVKTVTPTKGAIGPLTVTWLFSNLLVASGRRAKIEPKTHSKK